MLNALPHVPTKIHVANFSKELATLLKAILIGEGTNLPEVNDHLDQSSTLYLPQPPGKERKEKETSIADTVAAVQYKELKESQEDHMDRHKQVETFYNNMLDTFWRDKVNIGSQ